MSTIFETHSNWDGTKKLVIALDKEDAEELALFCDQSDGFTRDLWHHIHKTWPEVTDEG